MKIDRERFKRILESERGELFALAHSKSGSDSQMDQDPLLIYAQVVHAYLDARNVELDRLQERLGALPRTEESRYFSLLTKLRSQIRRLSVNRRALNELRSLKVSDPLCAGEQFFVCAMAFEALGDLEPMREEYEKAYRAFSEAGAKRRAVKALHNALAAKTRLSPKESFLSDYFFLYRQAKSARALGVAGTALYNLSIEYEKIGGLFPALKHANQAIALLHRDFRSRPFLLALAHRAHLLDQLDRPQEAETDLQAIEGAAFPEVRHALLLLKFLRSGSQKDLAAIDPKKLTPAWRAKYEALRSKPEKSPETGSQTRALSKMENHLIRLLTGGPKDKFELIQLLYGDVREFSAAENRLNNLFFRIRKKQPGLIIFQYGKYAVAGTAQRAQKKKAG